MQCVQGRRRSISRSVEMAVISRRQNTCNCMFSAMWNSREHHRSAAGTQHRASFDVSNTVRRPIWMPCALVSGARVRKCCSPLQRPAALVQRGPLIQKISFPSEISNTQHRRADSRLLQRATAVAVGRLPLPCQTTACRDLGGNRDHTTRQGRTGEEIFRCQRLRCAVKGDDQRRFFLTDQGRITSVACSCFSAITYMFVTSPTRSFSVRP